MKTFKLYTSLWTTALILSLLVSIMGCDGSKKSQNPLDDAIFENFDDIELCKTTNYKNAKLPELNIRACFRGKFEDSRNFNDFSIVSQNQETYYLISKGVRENSSTKFAIELTELDGKLVLQDFNKLYYTCIARYCEGCKFKFSQKGTISGCDCDLEEDAKPRGFAACEHTIGIKTLDKE